MTDLNKGSEVNLRFEQDDGAVWVFADDSQFGTEISHLMMMHADEYNEDELRVICNHAACEIDRLRAELEKAKAQPVPSQKYFSHDFNGDGFKYHDSLEEAKKEAEVNLDYYRDRVADGHHVADEGEFFELCYGVVVASAGYTVDDIVTEDHHKKDEFTKYEVGTEILRLHFNKCNSESGAEQ
ncbi:DUF551 domain-containing protein [Acinetobacter baumannii]|uniref:DUF551 domain-containing protein n=1 Tax=Acinetobacter baumannii TaxID=470 RepID=UPI0022B44A76|nr:DUF551 domain-containing protein [Acinetobacter baumannii]